LYYKEQCGTNVASLQLIDYEEDALRMLEKSKEEREIRILVTKSQEDQMQCEITHIKRRRHEQVSEEGIQDEDLDAYKLWLKKLPQDVDNPGTMY
jgi:tRNA uridine 5-carbamoylmethylation protein Kti12